MRTFRLGVCRSAMMALRRNLAAVLIVCIPAATTSHAHAGTSFTYQGVLRDSGVPVNGNRHLRFQLWDARNGGAQVGTTLDATTVQIVDGLLTVDLDFGSGVFDGSPRWLQVQIVSNGGATVTTLSPRQPIMATPYAVHAMTAAEATLPSVYAGAVSFSNAGNAFSGVFNGSGAGLINLDAGNIASGTINDARLSGNVARLVGPQSFLSPMTFSSGLSTPQFRFTSLAEPGKVLVCTNTDGSASWQSKGLWTIGVGGSFYTTENVGIGLINPVARLHIIGATPIHAETNDNFTGSRAILGWATGATAATRGVYARADSTAGTALYALVPATSGTTMGVYGRADSPSGNGVTGELTASTGSSYAVRGIAGPSTAAWAVYAFGKFGATGTKSFRIDHPLDPENKYLLHYCAEGPEPLNVYTGSARLDGNGEATVSLPAYFNEINIDPRIQLTAAGASMPGLFASEDVVDGQFQILGGAPNAKVYWEVKAVRNDRWVRRHGAPVEVEKPDSERGSFQHPEFYGEMPTLSESTAPAILLLQSGA